MTFILHRHIKQNMIYLRHPCPSLPENHMVFRMYGPYSDGIPSRSFIAERTARMALCTTRTVPSPISVYSNKKEMH